MKLFLRGRGRPGFGTPKYFKKVIAMERSFDKLRAPRRPKGFEDSVVCEPITEFPATGQD
ncbi:MAG TPA: hypothetical protein VK742_18465 [Candidatus Sulfotelmatobacter sp.]|nr:hypothetical protein [Candidatus Sulfotelmatobacter sp.]